MKKKSKKIKFRIPVAKPTIKHKSIKDYDRKQTKKIKKLKQELF